MWQINQSVTPKIPITIMDDSVGLVTGVLLAALRWDNGGAGTSAGAAGTLTEGTGNGTGSYFYTPTANETGTLGLCKLHTITAGNVVIGGDVLIGPMQANAAQIGGVATTLTATAGTGGGGSLTLNGVTLVFPSGFGTFTTPPTAAQNATATEQQIMDETDGRTVLQAIVAKINATDTDLAGLTTAAIATAVWANGTRALTDKTGFAPTAVAIRQEMDANSTKLDAPVSDAVNEARAASTAAGIVGQQVNSVSQQVDGVQTAVDAMPAAVEAQLSGTHGAGSWDAANLADLLIAGKVTTRSPVASNGRALLLVRGNDYDVASSQPLEWTDAGGNWPTLDGGTVTLTLRVKGSDGTGGAVGLELAGTVVVGSGDGKLVRFEPLHAATGSLTVGNAGYVFEVQAVLASGRIVTLVLGEATVREEQTR